MKTSIAFSLFMLLFTSGYSQKAWITGPDDTEDPPSVEVGDAVRFTAHFDPQGTGAIPNYYQWSVPFNGEHIHGVSNIDGSTDGAMGSDPVTRYSTQNEYEVDIVWGDFFDAPTDKVEVLIDYVDVNSIHHQIPAEIDVNIYIIILGNISNPSSIQKCCTTELEYCIPVLTDEDAWNWTISGGASASSSNGLHCIEITPNNTGNITVTVVASRTTNNNGYSRTATKTITRFDPVTQPISGFDYVCKGNNLTLTTSSVCGMTGITWSSGTTDLALYSGQGTTTATYRPNNLAANGTVVNITAQAQFASGCTANVVSKNITIFDSGTPSTPAGTLTLVPDDPEYDPCSDEEMIWYAVYNGTYANGFITVEPYFVLEVPHHHYHEYVDVEVCYRNVCGGGNACRTYRLYFPQDCVEDPIVDPSPKDSVRTKLESSHEKLFPLDPRSLSENVSGVKIYPNPASNTVSVFTNFADGFSIQIFDINGKLVQYHRNDTNFVNLDITNFGQGIYFARLLHGDKSIYKKLSIIK